MCACVRNVLVTRGWEYLAYLVYVVGVLGVTVIYIQLPPSMDDELQWKKGSQLENSYKCQNTQVCLFLFYTQTF